MNPVDLRVRTGDTRPSNPLNKKQCAEDDGREEVGLARAITPHDDVKAFAEVLVLCDLVLVRLEAGNL